MTLLSPFPHQSTQ